jgi:hypothetical protein
MEVTGKLQAPVRSGVVVKKSMPRPEIKRGQPGRSQLLTD